MHTVRISDDVKRLIDSKLAAGLAANEAAFVELAVLRYVDTLDDDTDDLIAAANEGIEAIKRGDYTTISSPEDQDALMRRIWTRAMISAGQAQSDNPSPSNENRTADNTSG